MKKKSVNPAMAMMAARAMRVPPARPTMMPPPPAAPSAMPPAMPTGMPPAMPGMKKGGMIKSDSKEDMKMDKTQDKAMIKKAFGMHDKQEHKGEHTDLSKLKKGGMAPDARSIQEATTADKNRRFGESVIQKRGSTDGVKVKMTNNTIGTGKSKAMCGGGKMAKGGSASSRADGIASKGKTRGKIC